MGIESMGTIKDQEVYSLSFGAGVQSTALLMLTINRDPRLYAALDGHWPELAVFADTGGEPGYVYNHLEKMKNLSGDHGFRLDVVKYGDLAGDILEADRFAGVPFFTINKDGSRGQLRRGCTRDYKIRPVLRHVKREILGLMPRQRMGKRHIYTILGISVDEAGRAKESRFPWETTVYPLLAMSWRRVDCVEYLEASGLGAVKKSACVFCPYRSTREWKRMKEEHPVDFAAAVDFDNKVRGFYKTGRGGVVNPLYVWDQREPLKDQSFGSDQVDLFDSWEDECDGVCGL